MLFGLDKLFSEHFHLNCYVADDAISCVALGTRASVWIIWIFYIRAEMTISLNLD